MIEESVDWVRPLYCLISCIPIISDLVLLPLKDPDPDTGLSIVSWVNLIDG